MACDPDTSLVDMGEAANTGLSGLAAPHVVLRGCHLQALSVEHAPALEALDLSRCSALSWFSLADCPQLRRLILPATGPGVELHLAFEAAPSLTIAGAVADLDLCWPGGSATAPLGRARRGPLMGAQIAVLGEAEPIGAALVFLLGAGQPVEGPVLEAWTAAREMTVVGLSEPSHLRLPPGVTAALLQCLPSLQQLAVTHAESLRIEQAPALTDLRGHGGRLAMVKAACTAPLRIHGAWHHVTIHDGALQGVIAPLVEELSAPRIAHGPSADGAIRALLADALSGDADAHVAILAWCRQVRTPRIAIGALQALQHLAEAGFAPEPLWQIRCTLRERLTGAGRPGWDWRLPADLQDRGWEADLRLWLACPGLPASALYGETPTIVPAHLATLATVLAAPASAAQAALLLPLLQMALRSGSYGTRLALPEARMDAQEMDQLRRVVQALAALRRHPACPSLAEEFCGWLQRNVPEAARLDLLGALHLLGAHAATAALLSEAATPLRAPEFRRRATALALAPARYDLLSFAEAAYA